MKSLVGLPTAGITAEVITNYGLLREHNASTGVGISTALQTRVLNRGMI